VPRTFAARRNYYKCHVEQVEQENEKLKKLNKEWEKKYKELEKERKPIQSFFNST